MLVWVDITGVNRGAPLLGQATRGHAEWPESLSFFILFSSFLPLPENVGKLDRRSGKIESYWTWTAQSVEALTEGKRASAGSQGSHMVIIPDSPASACLSLEEKPALPLRLSCLQTGTVSGPFWYWLILPGRTRQLVDRWEGLHESHKTDCSGKLQCTMCRCCNSKQASVNLLFIHFLVSVSSFGSSYESRCMPAYFHTQEQSKLNCAVNTNHSLPVCVRKRPALSIKPFPLSVSETVEMHGIIRQSNQGMWCVSWLKQIRLGPYLLIWLWRHVIPLLLKEQN